MLMVQGSISELKLNKARQGTFGKPTAKLQANGQHETEMRLLMNMASGLHLRITRFHDSQSLPDSSATQETDTSRQTTITSSLSNSIAAILFNSNTIADH
jgi:hypothetical protein